MSHQEVKDYLVELIWLLHIWHVMRSGNADTLHGGDLSLEDVRASMQDDVVIRSKDEKRGDSDLCEAFMCGRCDRFLFDIVEYPGEGIGG